MWRVLRNLKASAAVGAAVLAVTAGPALSAPALAADAGTTPLSTTARVGNGTVSTSVVVGSRLFVGGTFTTVDGATHERIAALDAGTGALDPSFTAAVNGSVTSLATDGSNVFVGGTFTSVNGVARTNVAELGPDGSLLPLHVVPSAAVETLDYADGVLYLGGKFTSIGAVSRRYLAGVNPATGQVTALNPRPNGVVRKLLAAPDGSLYVGGAFTSIGAPATARNYVADLDPASGAVKAYDARLPYEADSSDRATVLDIALSGGSVYLGTAGHLPSGNSLYKTTAGVSAAPVWQVQTDGDVQAVETVPGSSKIYAGGHFDNLCLPATHSTTCPSSALKTAKKSFTTDDATGTAQPWVTFNSALGVWDLKAAGNNLYALGSFTSPTPRIFAASTGPMATAPAAPQDLQAAGGDAQVQLSWQAPADDGGAPVTGYTLYRDSGSGYAPIGSVATTTYTDTAVSNGTTYQYTVSASNSVGEGPQTSPVSATPSASTVPTVPAAPVLSGTADAGANTLTWTTASDGGSPITGYTVLRDGTPYAALSATTSSYADTAITAGTSYSYQVTAQNAVGTSPDSNTVQLVSASSTPPVADGTVHTITATAETINRQPEGTNDADDPSFWVHPTDPSKSLIIGTIKVGGLDVYRTDGSLQQTISIPTSSRYNNVAVVYGINLGGTTRDLAVVTDRGTDKLHVFAINGAAGSPLTEVTDAAAPLLFGSGGKKINSKTAYGVTAWRDPATGEAEVFATQENTGNLAKFVLTDAGNGKIGYTKVASITLPNKFTLPNGSTWKPCFNPAHPDWTAHAEGMVIDPATGTLWADQEIVGLWKMTTGLTSPQLVHKLTRFGQSYSTATGKCVINTSSTSYGDPYLPGDLEGIGLYGAPTGSSGYLIISNQNKSTFTVFSRDGRTYQGTFAIGKSAATDAVNATDGVDVINVPMGPTYPQGLLVTQDGKNDPEGGTDFKLIPWPNVANALGLTTNTSGDPRA